MSVSKIVAAAASGVGGAGLDIDEVYSTFKYVGTGSAKTITNNIDLSGEGGLVWAKKSDGSANHTLQDTVRGATKHIRSNGDSSQSTEAQTITAFNSNGFSLGTDDMVNASSAEYISWTFRKAPHFFDVVTYTGTGSTRTLSHNLGTNIGMIMIKCTSSSYNWLVLTRGVSGYMQLNLTDGEAGSTGTTFYNNATTTQFTLTGGGNNENATGETYVAYIFAHNNSDGTFGPDSDQDVIKVGTYTGDGNDTGALQNLGFQPQWIMIKNTNLNSEGWHIIDTERGLHTGYNENHLKANTNAAELNHNIAQVESNGFRPMTSDDKTNGNGRSYLYMAIRRGPIAVPEDATKVFAIDISAASNSAGTNIHDLGFSPDLNINTEGFDTNSSTNKYVITRLTQKDYFRTHLNDAAASGSNNYWNFGTNFIDLKAGWWGTQADVITWNWKCAPSYLDIVAYNGTGSARTVTHGLGAVPEMMWIKHRSASNNWQVYHKGLNNGTDPEDYHLELNQDAAEANFEHSFNDTSPTSSVFTVGTDNTVNQSSQTYVAYLFATASGVSKVGSYSGNGSSTQTIDCGFSAGARFIILKRADSADEWYLFDTMQGIAEGSADGFFMLTNASAQTRNQNLVEPNNSGFIVNSWANGSGSRWIFYAVA